LACPWKCTERFLNDKIWGIELEIIKEGEKQADLSFGFDNEVTFKSEWIGQDSSTGMPTKEGKQEEIVGKHLKSGESATEGCCIANKAVDKWGVRVQAQSDFAWTVAPSVKKQHWQVVSASHCLQNPAAQSWAGAVGVKAGSQGILACCGQAVETAELACGILRPMCHCTVVCQMPGHVADLVCGPFCCALQEVLW